MKIVFIGCVEASYILLETLLEHTFDVVGVLTKETSRFNADFKDMAPLCQKYKIEYRYVQDINDKASIAFIQEKSPDYIFCFGWSQLIKKEILSLPKKGCVGYHPAALPLNRGRHPLIWALVLGLSETASTFFLMEEDCDSGDILSQEKINIVYEDTSSTLYKKVIDTAKQQVTTIANSMKTGNLVTQKQDHSKSNQWRKRGKEDGKIDFRMSSLSLYNLVRGLSKPYPCAHFVHGELDVKVYEAKEVLTHGKYKNIESGKVLEVYSSRSFLVKTGDNLLHIVDCDEVFLKKGDYL